MSASATDFERLLRDAIHQAQAAAPRAADDLVGGVSQAARAIDHVTEGAAALELVPLPATAEASPTYQLLLRKVGSEAPPSDLGIYCLSAAGYPIQRWSSRRKWEAQPERGEELYLHLGELESHFERMVSKPESRLVMLVTFLQQQASVHGNAAGSSH